MVPKKTLDELFVYAGGRLYWKPKPSVTWHRKNQKWVAQIGVDYATVYIGSYGEKADAIAAYVAEYQKRFGLGKLAGTPTLDGYRQVRINGKLYREHRVVFMLHHGWVPTYLDHINGVRDDNRVENLRPCTQTQNSYNTSGWGGHSFPKGVTWHKKARRYQAQISVAGRNKYLGQFKELQDAVAAVNAARAQHHGEFAKP